MGMQSSYIEGAILKAQNAIALKGDDPHFYHYLGNLLMQNGDLEGAEDAQKRAINLDPQIPGPHIKLSHIYDRYGDIENSILKALDAIALKGDNPHFYHHLGNLLMKKGNLKGAEAAQKRAINLDPHIPGPHIKLSHIYDRYGDIKNSILKALDAIALKGDNPHFHHHLGNLLMKKGNLKGAEAAQKRAINLDPHIPGPYIILSHIYDICGDIESAISKMQDAIALKEDNPYFHHHLGNLLMKKGDLRGAEAAQKRAINLDPHIPGPHIKLSHIYDICGNIEGAISKARDAIDLKEDDPHFYHHLGNLLLVDGNRSSAKRAFIKAADLEPYVYSMTDNEFKLRAMVKGGEIAIVPAGFRCRTKKNIFDKLKFKQASFPFDNGFFPPDSVASIIKNPKIDLRNSEDSLGHSVCIKHEEYIDPSNGYGIKFQRSSYEEINKLVTSRTQSDFNKYIDATYGYYTLDEKHNFVLAHYNWHIFANKIKSKGIYDHEVNIANINQILNRRIKRLFDICNSSKYIFLITNEAQSYEYMMVDDTYYNLHNFDSLLDAMKSKFSAQVFLIKMSDIDNVDDLIALIDS